MSPEQVRGAAVDHRCDIFSYGIVLHEMLTGRRVFIGGLVRRNDERHPQGGTARAAGTAPPVLRQIVTRCLEKQPDERFESIRDVAYALESICLQTERTTAAVGSTPNQSLLRRLISLSLAAGFGATLVAGAWWWFGRRVKLNHCAGWTYRTVAPRHGFEPRFTAPKAAVLPLDDRGSTRKGRPPV